MGVVVSCFLEPRTITPSTVLSEPHNAAEILISKCFQRAKYKPYLGPRIVLMAKEEVQAVGTGPRAVRSVKSG